MKRAGLCAVVVVAGVVFVGCEPCTVLGVPLSDCDPPAGVSCTSDDDLVCDIAEGDERGICLSLDDGSG